MVNDITSATPTKKNVVFVSSNHAGHMAPFFGALVPLFTKAGFEVHFFSSADREKKIQKLGKNVTFHNHAPSYQDLQEATKKTIIDRFGLPLTPTVQGTFFPEQILAATVSIMDDGILERVQELNPAVMICDVSALWGILTAKLLRLPLITSCSCTLFEESGVEGAFGYIRDLAVSQKCVQWIKNRYGIDYDAAYSYMNESEFTIAWSLPALQPPSRASGDGRVRFYGAALSETFQEDLEKEIVADRLLGPSLSVVNFIEQAKSRQDKVIYCSLGTVVGQEKWSVANQTNGNDMVTAFYKVVMETLGSRDGLQVILNIGRDRRVEDLSRIPSNFMVTHFCPQKVVLSMVDVFITHCGNNGVHEAYFFGCPMLCVPVFGDQNPNAATIEKVGAGVQIASPFAPGPSPNLEHVTGKVLCSKLDEVLVHKNKNILASCAALKGEMRKQHIHYHNNGMREMQEFINEHQA